jgi:hypothetical protein
MTPCSEGFSANIPLLAVRGTRAIAAFFGFELSHQTENVQPQILHCRIVRMRTRPSLYPFQRVEKKIDNLRCSGMLHLTWHPEGSATLKSHNWNQTNSAS